jgi:hypothetical protein
MASVDGVRRRSGESRRPGGCVFVFCLGVAVYRGADDTMDKKELREERGIKGRRGWRG